MRKFLLSLALAATVPTLALASDDSHSGHEMSSHEGMEGIHAEATVNSIDGNMANISHGPIAEIGWPAMTMDLPVLDGAEVGEIESGDDVMMMLEKGDDGMYAIRALLPKK
ncbi:copper-binding protein [Roseovarius sp. E0-M6]|uniref:copper-binding protein n=1 Tax=Roseovarius sp. E0-M6 TaxID=3127118 RepID=UPI0030100FC5